MILVAAIKLFFFLLFHDYFLPILKSLQTPSIPIFIENQLKFVIFPKVIWNHSIFRIFFDVIQH